MSIATKFEYLGETKEQIREGINKLGGGLSTSNTFRSYADKLDEIYDSMPKVEESDVESATLEGTIKGGLTIDPKGNTSQDTTTGKNKISLPTSYNNNGITITPNNNGTFTINGTRTSGSGYIVTWLAQNTTLEAGDYTFYVETSKLKSDDSLNIRVRDTDNNAAFDITLENVYRKVVNKTLSTTTTIGSIASWINVNDSINNANVKMMIVSGTYTLETIGDFEKYTGGIASPNPDYPQQIHEVSGDNEVVVCGKNLFDKNGTLATGYIVESDGHIGSGDNWRVSDYIPIQPNTAYTTSGLNNGAGNNPSRAYYDSNKTFISAKKHSDASPFIDTSPNNAYYMRESIRVLDLDTAQIEIGNTATTYQPYQSQTYPIYLGVENLFDGTMVAGRINTDGSIVGTSSEQNKHSNLIPIQANTPYTYYCSTEIPSGSAYCCNWYDSSQTRISTYNLSGKKVDTQISPINASYISISIYNVEGQQVQFTKGNKPSHISNTQLELCKIGDYQDYFTKNSDGQWCKYNAIGKATIDGTNYTITNFSATANNRGLIPIATFKKVAYSTQVALCNYFTFDSNVYLDSRDIVGFCSRNNNGGAFVKFGSASEINTEAKANNWLQTLYNNGTPLIFVGILDTPYLSLIEDETLISQLDNIENAMSYEGTTNISQVNNDKAFKLDLKAILDWRNSNSN